MYLPRFQNLVGERLCLGGVGEGVQSYRALCRPQASPGGDRELGVASRG